MDDHRPADDFLRRKAVGEEGEIGVSIAAEQRGHIPRVIGMPLAGGIEMSAGFGKGIVRRTPAGGSFVDMEAKNAVRRFRWQAVQFCGYQSSSGRRIKIDRSV